MAPALNPSQPSLVVVGGGITGLTAAFEWTKLMPGAPVTVLEATSRLGGKLKTDRRDGLQVEAGADSFLDRDGTVTGLCRELGLDLIGPSLFGGLVTRGDELVPLPAGTVMGFPTSVRNVLASRALSPVGKIRALGDRLSPSPLKGPDVAVGDFVRRRFGTEVLEFQVDPILAGTRAGGSDRLSLAAALPQIDAAARSHRSVIAGLTAQRKQHSMAAGAPAFLTPSGGLAQLVDALAKKVGEGNVHTSAAVTALRRDGDGWTVRTESGAEFSAHAVVVATPAGVTSRLLAGISERAAHATGAITAASVAVVTLVFDREVASPPGSGILVSAGHPATISAATWYSKKWPGAVRGSGTRSVIRAFIGRAGRHPALDLTDDDVIARVSADLDAIAGISAVGSDAWVTRWDDGMPQYLVGHRERVATARDALAGHPTLQLAGASFGGSGIFDCVNQAMEAARSVAAAVSGQAGDKVADPATHGRKL